jgi:hypothetical protein
MKKIIVLATLALTVSYAQAASTCDYVREKLQNGAYPIEISANGDHVSKGVVHVSSEEPFLDTYSYNFDIQFNGRSKTMPFGLGLREGWSESGRVICEAYFYDHISSYRHETIKIKKQELIFKAKKTGGFIKIKF